MIVYRLQHTNVEGNQVIVLISDTDTDGEPVYIDLTGSGSPVVISTVDNNEGKLTPIRSLQATITFYSDDQYGVHTFSTGRDDRFAVSVSLAGNTIFEGFLTLDDNQEAFVDGRNAVVLTASDKLASLRDAEFTDFEGLNPKGKYTIAKLCQFALAKTGLQLPLTVVNNLTHGSGERSASGVVFAAADSSITVDFYIGFFYVGQFITITSSASNNGTYRVVEIVSSTKIRVDSSLVNETASIYNVTFTDASSEAHLFDHYLEALTFEDDINTCISPYEVLERILGYGMTLFYYREAWWIVRHAERYSSPMRAYLYNEYGDFAGTDEITIESNFGRSEQHWFANAATIKKPSRPIGLSKVTYKYEYPREIVCNIDFTRGEVTVPPDMSSPSSIGQYSPECWQLDRLYEQSINSSFYIRKLFEYGYIKNASLAITPASATNTPFTFAKPVKGIPIRAGDKIDISVNYRFENNFGDGEGTVTYFPIRIWAVANDGKIWHWWNTATPGQPETFFWQNPDDWSIDPFTQYERLIPDYINLGDTDESEDRSISVNLSSIPVDAEVFIGLNQMHQGNDSGDNQSVFFSGLSVTYIPINNGSYQLYNGETHKVTRSQQGYLSKQDLEVFIADSIKPLFKGAIFFLHEDGYYLTTRWFQYGNNSNPKPFLWWMVFDIWNQYKNEVTVLEYEAQGVGPVPPWTIDKVQVTDADILTVDRLFEIITFETDLRLCSMRGTMPEIYRISEGYTYNDTYEFKYITT